MSGHTSRSRSPSTGPNGRPHSSSFGHTQALDPAMFNSSPYQAGANYQMDPNFGVNSFGYDEKTGAMNGGLLVDPALEGGSVNPSDVMASMSPQDQMSPTSGLGSGLHSQHHSPAMQNAAFPGTSPSHSRNQSLDPSSAGMPLPHAEWMGHRRSPSNQSDVSSVAHSPFQPGADFSDGFDANHSPLLQPSDQNLFADGIDMGKFSISEAQQRVNLSQQNSPYISPALVPAPANGGLPDGQFMLAPNSQDQYGLGDMGQASQFETPQINVEFAPNGLAQPQPGTDANVETLSPQRGRPGRTRALSDTSLGPGSMSRPLPRQELQPSFQQPGMLNAELNQPQRHRSLSPFDATFPSGYRGTSPGRSPSNRRSSTSSPNPDRNYILELADPNRPSGGSGNGPRVQKHPATFQCTMCPKRFTRAYNLRSHLRTHTDERPFVCSHCGKAFARQHDRKRHEGLHSGEKKFVCKGDLANGQGQWGCGRRFARADALGRHFRSEAGRVCIKPLLDEEMAEKRRAYENSVLAGTSLGSQMGQLPPGTMPPPAGVLPSQGPGVELGVSAGGPAMGFSLPQAILTQYPALQGLQWDQLGAGPVAGDDDGALSGRSSFDASGEVYDDEDGYLSGPGTGYAKSLSGWASDQGI